MKKNYIFVAMSLGLIIAFSQIVSAETVSDVTGDVAHWKYTGNIWGWDYNVANRPNIDITELSYSTSEGKVTLTMIVAGSIESSEVVVYWAIMNTSDSTYLMTYSNGQGGGYAMNIGGGGSGQMDFQPVTTVSGNTLSCTYNISSESFEGAEFWGYAAEYTNEEVTEQQEWWGDWAPNSNSPFYGDQPESPDDDDDDENGNGGSTNTTGNTTGTGTPGFEIIILLTAIFAFVLFARKRKM